MSEDPKQPTGPDLRQGVDIGELKNDMLLGHVGGEAVLVVRTVSGVFAIDAHCSHYHGPLADGLVIDDAIRCPWHHACFDLRTGKANRAPALSALAAWKVEQEDGRIVVHEKLPSAPRKPLIGEPRRIVIVGGGAAGFAAAEMLRREGFGGAVTMISAETAAPVDRPNLSKDYMAGSAPDE